MAHSVATQAHTFSDDIICVHFDFVYTLNIPLFWFIFADAKRSK